MKFTNALDLDVNDMGNIEEIVEIDLLNNLRNRFTRLNIHTNVGPTLIIMNPYKKIEGILTQEKLEFFIKMHHSHKVAEERTIIPEPHIYDLTLIAIMKLVDTKKNQAIIISGESGAGKTEAAKTSMACITNYFGRKLKKDTSNEASLEDQILSCNPILEGFGNSKTVRNNNSSRFGKYVTINLDIQTGEITGANIQTYLLEKSRVVEPSEGERNYHIFYQLLSCGDDNLITKLGLNKDPSTYHYLAESKCFVIENNDDHELFLETNNAFKTLGFNDDELFSVWKVVAVCLLMGNISFAQQGDHFIVDKPNETFKIICEHLGCKPEEFERSLTYKTRMMGTTPIESPNNQADCISFRNSFAKEIYNRLFNYIVNKLNKKLDKASRNNENMRYIGLLDIFGFENFKNNSLEQMCINFTNEKLQQLYINDIFKGEENFYIREGLKDDLHEIKFKDNQLIIDLMDKSKQGIFQLLDETCLTNGDDKGFLSKITKQCEKNPHFKIPKFSTGKFAIVHTAKEVEYNIQGFVSKNVDETRQSTIDCILNSTDKFIKFIFMNVINETELKQTIDNLEAMKKEKSSKSSGDKYLGSKFRNEMTKLMDELSLCECHYIRCLKPNELKKPDIFIATFTFQQIQYLGILDTIRVRKEGYPSRIPHKSFFLNFFDIYFWPNLLTFEEYKKMDENEFKSLCIKALDCIYPERTKQQVLLGNTKVLMKSDFYLKLQRMRDKKLEDKKNKQLIISKFYFASKIRRKIQHFIKEAKFLVSWYKSQKFRMKMRVKRSKVVKLQSSVRKYFIRKKTLRLKKSASLIYSILKMRILRKTIKIKRKAVSVIWRNVMRFLTKSRLAKRKKAGDLVYYLIDKTWEMIRNKFKAYYATKIQALGRSICARKKFKGIILKGKEKRKLFNQTKLANKIARYVRGYIFRKKFKRQKHLVMKIQSYLKMTKLYAIVNDMRRRCLIIQRNLKTRYLMKSAINNRLKEFYDAEELNMNQTSLETRKALFPNEVEAENERSPKKNSEFIEDEPVPQIKKSFRDTVLPEPSPYSDPKIILFARIIQIDFLIDCSEIYESQWATEYNKIYVSNMKANTPIQQIILGGFHTVAINNKGAIFSWGWNNFGQCAVPSYSTFKNEVSDLSKIVRDSDGKFSGIPIINSIQSGKSINSSSSSQIKSVSCGEEHTSILDENFNLYTCGRNTEGQLGHGNITEVAYPTVISELKSKISLIKSFKDINYAVSTQNDIYVWPFCSNLKPKKINFDKKITISQISCGNNFSFFLSNHGVLFSFGSNKYGELGLGDHKQREKPEIMNCFFESGERIIQISCGFKHSVAISANGKAFSWGLNNNGQLASGNYGDLSFPKQVSFEHFLPNKIKTIQVAAGFRSSFFMSENRQIYYSGKYSNTDESHPFVVKVDLKTNSPEVSDENAYSSVKINCTWNKTMSVFYAIMGDIQDLNRKSIHKTKINNVLNTLSSQWVNDSYDPPYIKSISGFFSNSYMRPPKAKDTKLKKNESKMEAKFKEYFTKFT